jgi:hypothetical protein
MVDLKMKNATPRGGAPHVGGGGQAPTTKQKKTYNCDAEHIRYFVNEIRWAGLQLRGTSGDTQLATLPKVLEYLGSRGANTYELVALGYLRAATRVKDLEDQYEIASLREDVVGPDEMFHKGVARYVLIGKRKNLLPEQPQAQLDLGAA